MDLEQIRAFMNVASLKSFSEAAEKMFISQPSVSVRIKALEEELGVLLFDRSKAREPVLTEAGRTFLDYAYSIINLQDECREKLSGQREQAAGLIYVGASTVPGTYLLPALLAGFIEKSTNIEFNVNILDTSAVLEGIMNYSYDLGLVGLVKEEERLTFVELADDELVLCTRPGLIPQAENDQGVSVALLFEHHILMREKGSATRQLLEKKLLENNFDISDLPGITYINNLEGIKQAVRTGLGVAVISKLSVRELVSAGAVDIFPINDLDLSRRLYLVYHRNRVLSGAAMNFRDYIQKKHDCP